MTYCLYQEIAGLQDQRPRRLRCVHCGFVTEPTDFPLEIFQAEHSRECPRPSPRQRQSLPSLPEIFWNYAQAVAKYLVQGQKLRPPSQVEQIFIEHCSPCEHYQDLVGACCLCGCYVNPRGDGKVQNKLLWQSEACPDQPPRWK